MSEQRFDRLDEPSEDLKQELALLILDNVPEGPEEQSTFNHPDGREIALMRPLTGATDPEYESDDPMAKFNRSYSVYIETPVMNNDANIISEISKGYRFDPVANTVEAEDTSILANGIVGVSNGAITDRAFKDMGLYPTVSGTELQGLIDDIKTAIANTRPQN